MNSHLSAATVIVIFKDYTVKGRKLKTGWSHNTQRQLQQQQLQGTFQPIIPQPHRQQPLQMQPQMAPIPMAAAGYMYQNPMQNPMHNPLMYNAYIPHAYPLLPPNGTGQAGPATLYHNGTGTSTPHSIHSGNGTPSIYESKPEAGPIDPRPQDQNPLSSPR